MRKKGEIIGGVEVEEVIPLEAGGFVVRLASKYSGHAEPGSQAAKDAIEAVVRDMEAAKTARKRKNVEKTAERIDIIEDTNNIYPVE